MIQKLRNGIPAFVLLLAAGVAAAQAQQQTPSLPAGITKAATVEGMTEYRLQNGLRVVLFPDPTKTNATVNITYMVGSRHEDYGETGMAHLLEHLMFKGSKNHPNVPKELTDHGARPNGTTWFDRTNYFETFTATDENLDWALSLEADRMVNSFIAKKDLDSEMTVVRNEFEAGENSPIGVMMKRLPSVAYDWHNYGNSTIGARADIENVPIERLQAFWKHFYQPDNAVLVVAGKIDEPKTLGMIAKHFGPIPKPTRQLRRTYTVEPTQDGERTVTLRRVGDSQAAGFLYKMPPGTHEDFPALDLAIDILSDRPSGRLYKALVDSKKAANVMAFAFREKEPGMALGLIDVRKEQNLEEAKNTMLATLDNIAKSEPFQQDELDRVRRQWTKNFDLQMNDSQSIALELSEWQAMGDWRLMFLYRDRIERVTLDQMNAAYKKYFVPSNRTVGLFIPEDKPVRAEIPAPPDVEKLVADYKGRQTVSLGESFDPSPENIDKRTIRGELQGGVKLSFINKKTRGNQVVAQLALHFGDENSLRNTDIASMAAGQLLMRGTAKHTRQQLKDEFDKLKANVMISGNGANASARVVTTRENLMPALALVEEVLKEPSFPAEEFEKWRQETLAGLEKVKSEPQQRAVQELTRHLNPYPKGDIRYEMGVDETIDGLKALTLEDVKKFYREFYGASNGELSVIGDFDAEAVQQQASKMFNSWKSPKKYVRVDKTYKKIEPKAETMPFADKANAMWVAGTLLPVNDNHPDYPALVFGNFILGGSMNSRLFARIRGKEGLSYGVGSMLAAPVFGNAGQFLAYAICAPQNAPKVEASFKDEMAAVLEKGYTAEEVETAKKAWLQGRQVSRANDTELVSRLNGHLVAKRTMAWEAELEAKVKALTPEQIRAAMKRHLAPEGLSFFRAGDFEKANVKF